MFKKGDKVRVIDDSCNHCYKVGDVLEIVRIDNDSLPYGAVCTPGFLQFFEEGQIELVSRDGDTPVDFKKPDSMLPQETTPEPVKQRPLYETHSFARQESIWEY